MAASVSPFVISTSLRVPGLGVLALPGTPPPGWLAATALHTALALHLHRPGQPPLALCATIEEVSHAPQPPTRALLLDADPGGELLPGAWLSLEGVAEDQLF
jgi:hypothetical protein